MIISREEIVGQTIKKCFETKGDYPEEAEITCSRLIIELQNGLLLNLPHSFDDERLVVDVDAVAIENELKTSNLCFDVLWGKEVKAIVASDYIYKAAVLLTGDIVIQVLPATFHTVEPVYDKYELEADEQLLDFWDNTPIELTK